MGYFPEKLYWRKAGLALALLGLAFLAYQYLAPDWIWDREQIEDFFHHLRSRPLASVWVGGSFILGTFLFVPVTALIAAVATLFSPWNSLVITLTASMISSIFLYFLGRLLGQKPVAALSGPRLLRLSERLRRRGITATIVLRLTPVAHFTIINLVAGALVFPFSAFFLGSLIGMLPSIVAIIFVTDRFRSLILHPDWKHFLMFLAVSGGLILLVGIWRRSVWRRALALRARKNKTRLT
ncbi:MAG: TVP38/TMEM64 family protein [Thermodesulfobacteriota bacterium]